MSKTQFKNAQKMWKAFDDLCTPKGESLYERVWHTVGEVSKASGLSKPTVKKYLDMATDEGLCVRLLWNGRYEYRRVYEES